jgi:LysM repeat protein
MEDNERPLNKVGGHLALIAVAALLFIGARSLWISDLLDYQLEAEGEITDNATSVGRSPSNLELLSGQVERSFTLSDFPTFVNSSISPNLYPATFQGEKPHHELITYTVQPQDTPIGIAEKFGIRSETILGGNAYLSEESSSMQVGANLLILPIDGVLHDVVEGETLEGLSELYGIDAEEIISYVPNNLEFPFRLYPGTQIMVPGAVREVFVWSAPSLPSRPSTSDSTGSGIAPLVQGTGTFIWPVAYRRITQQFWYGHGAIDIGMPMGNSVSAADTGTVTWAGWNVYGYGNLVVINHGNGYETYYGHMSNIGVVPGQVVNQGQYIGASGNSGRSSGPHLHFEIRYFNSMLGPLSILR